MAPPPTMEMDMAAPQTLIEHFSKLEDPRVERNKKCKFLPHLTVIPTILDGDSYNT